jgi:plastocyanin
VFTLAINSARGPGVSTRWAARLICAIPALLLLPLATAAYPQATTDGRQASIAPPASIASPGSAVRIVQMNDDMPMYQPDSIVITAGQTVEWHNNGQVSHSVVDDAKRAAKPDDALIPRDVSTFSSGNIMPGHVYKHTFKVPGRYRYFCMSHELDGMVGEVIVRPASPGGEPPIVQANSQAPKNLTSGENRPPQISPASLENLLKPPTAIADSNTGPVKIIQMNDDAPMYQPNSIVITAGQTVEWHNNGQVSHSVMDDAKRAAKPDDALIPGGVPTFSSGSIMPGGTYKHTFTVPGRYRYFCASHELDDMVGEITVLAAPPGAEPLISQAKSQPWKNLERSNDPPVPDP